MTPTVFIVEDELTIQDSLKVVLEGYLRAAVVGTARSETEAVMWLTANRDRWHLLVVDLTLLQGNGLGVLAALAALGPRSGLVVALTNSGSADHRAQCLTLGADAVFDKAAEINEFLAFCAEGLGGKA